MRDKNGLRLQIGLTRLMSTEDEWPTILLMDKKGAGNLCRCMAYRRIHRAVKRAAEITQAREADTAGVGLFDPARDQEVTHGQV